MAGLDDEHQCTRCLEVLEYLIDPKQLPCHHVYCSVCLDAVIKTVDNGLEVECSYCGKTHNFVDIAALNSVNKQRHDKAEVEKPSEDSEDIDKPSCLRCDLSAVCYCVDCGERYCSTHEDQHNKWYTPPKKHKLISIGVYLDAPGLKSTCANHQESLVFSCQKCYKMSCSKCTTAKNDCIEESRHNYQSLFDIEKLLKHQFHQLFEKCTGKLSELAKLEKRTWQRLDDERESYEGMRKRVEKSAQAKIVQINEEKESILQQIDGAEETLCESVENYLDAIRMARDKLEQRLLSCRQFLRENSVTEIIAQREGKYTWLEKMSMTNKPGFPLLLYKLEEPESVTSALNIQFSPTKLDIQSITTYNVKGECYAISRNYGSLEEDGVIYVTTHKGVTQHNTDMEVTARLQDKQVYSICAAPSNKMFILQYSSLPSKVLLMTDHSFKNKPTQIFEFVDKINVASYMAYLENGTLLITDRGDSCIYALNINNSFSSKTIKLPFAPCVVYSHPDGSFLLTSLTDCLYKCRLSDSGEIQILWTCENLPSAYGISVKDNGLIIVCSCDIGNIYLLTPQGIVVQTIYDYRLKEVVGAICSVGDKLFLPCWEKQRFLSCILR